LSTQTEVPVVQDVTPVRHGSGLVVQTWPAVQLVQTPPLQTWFVPQAVPLGSLVVVATQTEAPVAHDVAPVWHGSGSPEQATPAMQVTHEPALQTRFEPQLVPFDSGDAGLSTQTDVPVEHEVIPVRHRSGLAVQASPGVQATHDPPLQTRFVPQPVPFGSAIVVATQVCVPVVQDVVPVWHGSGSVVQASPAVQPTHAPPLQTRFVPQLVPSVRWVDVSRQVSVPVEQSVMPATHGFGFVEQPSPVLHAPQTPLPSQTAPVPQLAPAGSGAPSRHTGAPVEQEVVPS
jgi:hypothetical protein